MMKKFGAKFSIRKKMMFIFVGLILFLLILLVFVNGTFAEWYYVANKRSDLVSIYKEISKVQEKDLLGNDAEVLKLNRMTERNNVSVLLIDSSMRVKYANVYDVSILKDQVQDYVLGNKPPLLDSGEYLITRSRDVMNGAEYLEMWAQFENSNYLLMRCSLLFECNNGVSHSR